MEVFFKLSKIYLLLFLFFLSCKASQDEDPDLKIIYFDKNDIADKVQLKGQHINFPHLEMPEIIYLLEDGTLVVYDKSLDLPIHLFGTPTVSFKNSLGKRGEGPGELQSVFNIYQGDAPHEFLLHQIETKRISEFSVNQESNLAQKDSDFGVPELFSMIILAPASDSSFMSMMYASSTKFTEVNFQSGEILNEFGDWKSNTKERSVEEVYFDMFQGHLSSYKNVFAIACRHFDHLEVLDAEKGKLLSIRGPENYHPKFTFYESSGSAAIHPETIITMYIKSTINQDGIYALYSGKKPRLDVIEGTTGDQIFYFNHLGELERTYDLDIPLSDFQVDAKHKKIYGLSPDAEGAIVVFDLAE
ncbi:MAG: TolB-like 6-bladed beta-propeller domain-containing protein [Cyclobacteriaceae bacterium]|nr:hypothetical protein [Cyclobacteriaceae bacterium]MCH8517310.1 TolB-like 6-bladed beta-propeller domain-containing protein [Cyclobacteriaceae bacterium]